MRYDPGLVLLSVLLAALGGYVGFGFARSSRTATGARRKALLAAAAAALGLGIWTMHFVGMLAAELPAGVGYAVLPTLLSFLLCVLVVGVAVFFTAAVPPSPAHLSLAALAMGLGIATMHYLGMSALRGVFCAGHDPRLVAASIAVGIAVSAGALVPFARPQTRLPLAPSALLFGIAVAGLHYTAMAGVELDLAALCAAATEELVFGEQELAIVVALLGFVVAGGFLLHLLPDAPPAVVPALPGPASGLGIGASADPPRTAAEQGGPLDRSTPRPLPLRVPVRGFEGVRLLDPAEILWLRAEAHYTRVFDGRREGLCDWSISVAESKLAAAGFFRCHRCHLVRLDRVRALRRAGKGGVVLLEGEPAREVPVSRGRLAELERRLWLRVAG
ncbi:MAG: LytTR family transcriptional regulator DNA-binding domain-containing protein [Geminicoccaceae bacterium]|nr:LytTR family transcriptional regulator DNA-binding domain-containing protein [Geminicoccaceae bacterium]